MVDDEFPLYNMAALLSACKDVDYKESIIRMTISLMRFLRKNDLLAELNSFYIDNEIRLDLIIKKKHLTDDGFELFRRGIVDGWLEYLDRSAALNKYENVGRLEKGLLKIRGEKVK